MRVHTARAVTYLGALMQTSANPVSPDAGEGQALVDPDALRAEIRLKYAEVATDPDGAFHFHTGRPLATQLGYPAHPHVAARLGDGQLRRRRQPLQGRADPR